MPDPGEEDPVAAVRPEGFSLPHAIIVAVTMNADAKERARGVYLLTLDCMLGFVRVCPEHMWREGERLNSEFHELTGRRAP